MSSQVTITVPVGTRIKGTKGSDMAYRVIVPVQTDAELVEVKTQKNRHLAYACPNAKCWPIQTQEEKKVQVWRTGKQIKVGPRCGYCDSELTTAGYAAMIAATQGDSHE